MNKKFKLAGFCLLILLLLTSGVSCGGQSATTEKESTTISQETDRTEESAASEDKTQEEETSGTTAEGSQSQDTTKETSSDASSQSSDESTQESSSQKTETSNLDTDTPKTYTVTVQVNCKLLLGKDLTGTGLESLVPSNGILLATTKVTISPGETVYDATKKVARDQGLHMSVQGTVGMGSLYVDAFGNLYEKAYNSKSGWVYQVNGTKPATSAGLYELKDGDSILWSYSLDNGNDI